MDVLSSRTLLRCADPARSRQFYGQTLGLAVYREFGDPEKLGTVFYLGNGLLEVSGHSQDAPVRNVALWLQVRDVYAEHERLEAAGVVIDREPVLEPWGLLEMWISDPDGLKIDIVQVPDMHPLRRDPR